MQTRPAWMLVQWYSLFLFETLFRNCHSEAKPKNLVLANRRKDEMLRCAQHDTNGALVDRDTVSDGARSRWGCSVERALVTPTFILPRQCRNSKNRINV